MSTSMNHPPPRESDEYPHPIQQAGKIAMQVFDRVEQGLLADGFTQDEADMLLQINIPQILDQAKREAAGTGAGEA